MNQFQVKAKLWPAGTDLDLGTDFNSFTPTSDYTRHATNFVTSADGTHNYQFLFWNTGRHLTNKRYVHWTFNVDGWGLWTATKWYGTPPSGPGGGPPRVRADAFTLGGNAPLGTDTPIDGTASTYPAGAYPFMGNDHEIDTSTGAVTVVAKDPFASLQFAGWLQLVWGGDDSDTFEESDTGSAPGSATFYDHVTSGPFPVGMGGSADLLATYGNHDPHDPTFDLGRIWEVFFPGEEAPIIRIRDFVDPPPEDILRLKILQNMLQQTRPGTAGGPDFQRLIEAAPSMNSEELNRAIQSVQVSLDLGKTALSMLEAQLKRGER